MSEVEGLLINATEALLKVDCQFEHCEGFEKEPEDMVTCSRCRVLYDIKIKQPAIFKIANEG